MAIPTIPETLSWATMPLSVYREVAAHLRQVSGVEVELLPQSASEFDYGLSQVGGLHINGEMLTNPEHRTRVVEILNYYCGRFGDWQAL